MTRATRSSPRFLPLRLSQDGAGADPEDGIRVGLGRGAQSCRASVEGQPAGRRGRASNTFSVDRAAEAVGPTISSGLKERPRLSSHKFQSHGNAQAHRRGYSILLNSFVEKESSIPLVIQFSVLYGCSAEKSVIVVQLSKEIELHPEISVISLF